MTDDPKRSHDGLEVLSEQQCLELLASRDLGRIAFSVGDQPEIFPVNYATDGSVVVFSRWPLVRENGGSPFTQERSHAAASAPPDCRGSQGLLAGGRSGLYSDTPKSQLGGVKVTEIMSRHVITVMPDTSTNAAVELLIEHDISALPVVGSNGELVGIVSEADLLPFATRPHLGTQSTSTVASVMTGRVLSVPDSCEVARVARILLEADYQRVPVVRDGKVVGIVSRRDLVKVIARRDELIKTEITARFEQLGLGFGRGDIGVEVGVVTVRLDDHGTKRRRAESVARSVPGVMEVRFR